MDPNANFAEQEAIIIRAQTHRLTAAEHHRFIELRIAYAQWMRHGGFAPNFGRYPWTALSYGMSMN